MREGFNNSFLVLNQKLVGINLGADYCAEHEWGIKDIRSSFGIDESKFGINKRKISTTHSDLHWITDIVVPNGRKKKPLWSGIYFQHLYGQDKPSINTTVSGRDFITLWDGGSFCAISSDKVKIGELKEVYDSFANNDIAIWLGGKEVFKNAGLCIAIASRLPKDITDAWHKHDVDEKQLMDDFDATGIKKKLKDADKRYFALSPNREKDGSLKFWLNPMEQDKNKSGWFTISDLEQWTKNEGPIVGARKI